MNTKRGFLLALILTGVVAVWLNTSFYSVVGVRLVPGEVHIGDTLRHKFVLFCDDPQGCFGVRAATSLVKPTGGTANTVSLNKDMLVSSDGIGFSGISDSFDTMLPYTHTVTLYAKDFTLFDTYPTGNYSLDTKVEYLTASGAWKPAFSLSESVEVLPKPAGASSPANQPPVVVPPVNPAHIVASSVGCVASTNSTSAWSACTDGLRARIVTDSCGGRVQESESCALSPVRFDYLWVWLGLLFLLLLFLLAGKRWR